MITYTTLLWFFYLGLSVSCIFILRVKVGLPFASEFLLRKKYTSSRLTLSLLFITRVNVPLYIEISQCTYNFIDREQVQTETDRCEKTLYNTFTFIDCCYGVNQ